MVSIVYSLKSVGIVTECIGDYNDTNKRNNCLSLVCALKRQDKGKGNVDKKRI